MERANNVARRVVNIVWRAEDEKGSTTLAAMVRDEIAQALAEAAEGARAWQPMETAPDDGTLVLLIGVDKFDGYDPPRERIIASRWRQLDHGGFGWEFSCPGYSSEFAPFAWSPLPDEHSAAALRAAGAA